MYWSRANLTELNSDPEVVQTLESKKYYRMMKTYFQSMVLPKHGGVFLDHDYICLRPFDELVHKYEYFSGFEPYPVWTWVPIINTGLHAAAADSKIMKRFKRNIENYFSNKGFFQKVNEFTDLENHNVGQAKNQNLVRFTVR